MNEKISIAQWLAFVGPQLLLTFQIWREGRFDRQHNAQNWADIQKKWLETQQELLKISQRVERIEIK